MTRLYVAMEDELMVVSRENGGWQVTSHLDGLHLQCLAADPLRPEMLYVGTFGEGVWGSDDAGATWQPAGAGIHHAEVTAVAVSGVQRVGGRGVVWAGTEPSALFRSEDGGASWQEMAALRRVPSAPTWSFPPRPWTHHVRWIAPDATEADRIFVCVEAGAVLRSLDGGRSWEDRKPDAPRDVHTLQSHRLAPGRLYAAAGDGYMAPGNGYAESHDGGATWQRLGGGLRHHYLWSVAVDPGNPDTAVVSAATGPGEAHDPLRAESTLYSRANGGSWQETRTGLPEPKGTLRAVLAANEAESGVFYTASNRGVFRSADGGLTWEQLVIGWPERFHRQHAQALVATG